MPESNSKPGWTRVAFGDVVQLSRERSSDPEDDGFDRYVGLEHVEPGDFKIRRWGDISDGTTFTRVFRAGQVLFGKRRAYQRKVAVADFDGVCSGDIYALEPKNARLPPDLLPFICQTDGFFEHAIGTSAGSLSPRTNWKSLAAYEFDLPPLEEQRRMARVLSGATSLAHLHHEAAAVAERVSESLLVASIRGENLGELIYDERFGRYSRLCPLTPLGDLLLATQYGLSEPSTQGGEYPMLRMMDLSGGLATEDDLCSVDLSDEDFSRYRLEDGDVLFNRTNSHDLVGRTGIYKLAGDHVFASYLVRLRTNDERLLPEYLSAFLSSPLGRRQVMRFATRGVSQTNVNASNLRNVLIPLPSIDYQRAVCGQLGQLRFARRAHQGRSSDARGLATQVANDFLGTIT